jgi:hypothetical protein
MGLSRLWPRPRDTDFKLIWPEFRPPTRMACDYTKRPEVTSAPRVVTDARRAVSGGSYT